MSIMDELRNIKALRADIEALQNRRARLWASMEGLSPRPRQGSRGTAVRDRMATAVARLEELDCLILERIVAAESRALEIESIIDALPGIQRRIIRLYYIDGLTWEEVAKVEHYSSRRCQQIHDIARATLAG